MGVTGLGSFEFYRSYSCPSRHRPSTDFGAFIEIKEGFIPTSKLTTDNLRNPAEAFKPGDTVPAAVIEVDGPTGGPWP
jgi:transcriptional accessory protein Tex/SPT6